MQNIPGSAAVDRSQRPTPVWAAALFLLVAVLFFAIAEDVATNDPLTLTDRRLALWFVAHRTPALSQLMSVVSTLHGTVAATLAAAAAAAWLWKRDERLWLRILLVATIGGTALNVGMKYAFHRLRPAVEIVGPALTSFSFPSGHVASSTVLYGVVCAFAFAHVRSRLARAATLLLCMCAVALVALSRMYLGFHYLSDVMAAFCEGLAWVTLCISFFMARPRHAPLSSP